MKKSYNFLFLQGFYHRYNSAYSNALNEMIACPLMEDLVEKFGGTSEDFDQKILNGTFYFSHSEALLPFLSLLGLYK